jgi:methyl-accepting chemotaxis protein
MNLKVKFALISGLPLMGLCVAILASYMLAQSIEHKTRLARDKNVTFADCARRMQLDVVQVQQWLTDISATRGQDGLDDGFKEAEESYKSFLANLNKFRAEFQLEQNDEQLRKLADLEKNFEAYYEKGRIMAAAYIKDGPTAGNQIMSEFDATASLLTETLTPFVEAEVEKFHAALMGISDFTHSTSQWMALGGLVIILLAVTFTYIQIRSITQALGELATNLDSGSLQTASAARQVSMASNQLSSGSSEQASSVEETSSSLEEMSSMIRATADNAQKAKALASDASHEAEVGAQTMLEMMEAMKAIDSSSAEVAKIVKNIDEIAFQTNILALNAAVEAARAGDAGAGFAVVADEVRSLAQRSAGAAKETADKIEAAIANSRSGSACSAKVGDSLKHIAEKVAATDALVAHIATAATEQAQGIQQINNAMNQMDKVTQGNAANAEESASAAEELDAQAETMKNLVSKLRELIGGTPSKPKKSSPKIIPIQAVPERSHAIARPKRVLSIPMPNDPSSSDPSNDDFRNF